MDEQPRQNPEAARQRREERMRYEVLDMLYRASARDPERRINCRGFAEDIGVWQAEVFRVVDFLDRIGFIQYCGAGPVVCITERGIDYLERGAGRRKRISDRP